MTRSDNDHRPRPIDAAPLTPHPYTDEVDAIMEDSFKDIGIDAALDQLRTVRKTIANEKLWDRVEKKGNEVIDVPWVPEALEATAFDTIGDAARMALLTALDELIEELEEQVLPS